MDAAFARGPHGKAVENQRTVATTRSPTTSAPVYGSIRGGAIVGSTSPIAQATENRDLVARVTVPFASFTADGSCERAGVHAAAKARRPETTVIVPPRSSAVPSDAADAAPSQRAHHLRDVGKGGCRTRQVASGHGGRALAEAGISRFARGIGGSPRSRADRRRVTEVGIAVGVLNHMLELGCPEHACVA